MGEKRQIQAPRKKMQNAVLTQIFFLWVVFPNLIQIVEQSFKGCWWTFLPASTSVHVLVVVVVVVIVVVVVVIVVVVVVVDVDSVDHGEDSVGHGKDKRQKTKGCKLSMAAWGKKACFRNTGCVTTTKKTNNRLERPAGQELRASANPPSIISRKMSQFGFPARSPCAATQGILL